MHRPRSSLTQAEAAAGAALQRQKEIAKAKPRIPRSEKTYSTRVACPRHGEYAAGTSVADQFWHCTDQMAKSRSPDAEAKAGDGGRPTVAVKSPRYPTLHQSWKMRNRKTMKTISHIARCSSLCLRASGRLANWANWESWAPQVRDLRSR